MSDLETVGSEVPQERLDSYVQALRRGKVEIANLKALNQEARRELEGLKLSLNRMTHGGQHPAPPPNGRLHRAEPVKQLEGESVESFLCRYVCSDLRFLEAGWSAQAKLIERGHRLINHVLVQGRLKKNVDDPGHQKWEGRFIAMSQDLLDRAGRIRAARGKVRGIRVLLTRLNSITVPSSCKTPAGRVRLLEERAKLRDMLLTRFYPVPARKVTELASDKRPMTLDSYAEWRLVVTGCTDDLDFPPGSAASRAAGLRWNDVSRRRNGRKITTGAEPAVFEILLSEAVQRDLVETVAHDQLIKELRKLRLTELTVDENLLLDLWLAGHGFPAIGEKLFPGRTKAARRQKAFQDFQALLKKLRHLAHISS